MREARLCLTALIIVAALPGAAFANHSVTELVSTGPDAGAPSTSAGRPVLTSADGSRAFFETSDRLVPADGNESQDVYERAGGVTTLISTGPSGAPSGAELLHVSADGSRVTFSSYQRLTGEDHDDTDDIHQRAGGVTRLISTGPTDRYSGFSSSAQAFFDGASADGAHVVFHTSGALVSADTDTQPDLYERFGGQTTLVSTGPTDDGSAGIYTNGGFAARSPISDDGAHIFFLTQAKLVPEDVDTVYDYYERTGGTTKLVSTGPTDTGTSCCSLGTTGLDFDRSADGTHVIFTSLDRLVAEDVDNQMDVYERTGNTTTLVSTGPTDTHMWAACSTAYGGGNCPPHISDDGNHIFFFTHESLTTEDTSGYLDLYDRSGSTVRLVSIGPSGGNGPYHVSTQAPVFSADGSHVFFSTGESLVPEDTDTAPDIYERYAGTTTLVSTGPPESDPGAVAPFGPAATSADGLRLFWVSHASSIIGDTNTYDIYERYAGTTTLIGPSQDGDYYYTTLLGFSPDGTRVFFNTNRSLVPEDTDVCNTSTSGCIDTYEKRVASVGPQSPAGSMTSLPDYRGVIAKGESSALP
jgi:hypothetical protein